MKDEILNDFMTLDFESQGERMYLDEYERNTIRDYIINLEEKVKSGNNIILADKNRIKELKKDIKGYEQERENLFKTIYELQEENKQLKEDIELLTSNEYDNDSVWFEEDNM